MGQHHGGLLYASTNRILVLGLLRQRKINLCPPSRATLTSLPVVHLDALFWKPGWVQASREEFYPALQDALFKGRLDH